MKRVVGVPGDRVRLINRQVYVNGHPLQEPMSATVPACTTPSATSFRGWIFPFPALKEAGGWK